MKATTWLCPVFTLLCATKLVYTAQRETYGGYALDDMDSQMIQNDDFRSKRNKPSLSIVNPLDVLRQRLLLEIARRQMKENSRQVELNRAILKNVGKRMANKYSTPWTGEPYNVNELQQRQWQQQRQQQMQQEILQHMPNTNTNYEYDLMPMQLFFDYIQKQQQQQKQQKQQPHYTWLPYVANNALQYDNNYINDVIDGRSNSQRDDYEDNEMPDEIYAINNLFADSGLGGSQHSLKSFTQTNNEKSNLANEPNNKKTNLQISNNSRVDDKNRLTLLNNNHQTHHQNSQSSGGGSNNNINLDSNDGNPVTSSNQNANDLKNEMNINGSADYQIQRYLYHLHKNHLTRK